MSVATCLLSEKCDVRELVPLPVTIVGMTEIPVMAESLGCACEKEGRAQEEGAGKEA